MLADADTYSVDAVERFHDLIEALPHINTSLVALDFGSVEAILWVRPWDAIEKVEKDTRYAVVRCAVEAGILPFPIEVEGVPCLSH